MFEKSLFSSNFGEKYQSVLFFTYRWKQWLLMTCYPTQVVTHAICNSVRSVGWHYSFLVVTDKYFVSWFDSRPGPDMTTHVRYSRCKGTECPVVPQSICQYLDIITSNKNQHFWMHRTTWHHYGFTWPNNKSWHQTISNSHIRNGMC